MKYTKEQIDKLKRDPYARMLSILAGVSIDDVIADILKENENTKESSDKITNNTETCPTYPLSVEEFKYIISLIKDLYSEMNKFDMIGIDLWATKLGYTVWHLLNTLLEGIFDTSFMTEFDKQDFFKDDVDQITNNLISYLERNNG